MTPEKHIRDIVVDANESDSLAFLDDAKTQITKKMGPEFAETFFSHVFYPKNTIEEKKIEKIIAQVAKNNPNWELQSEVELLVRNNLHQIFLKEIIAGILTYLIEVNEESRIDFSDPSQTDRLMDNYAIATERYFVSYFKKEKDTNKANETAFTFSEILNSTAKEVYEDYKKEKQAEKLTVPLTAPLMVYEKVLSKILIPHITRDILPKTE